MKPVHHRGIIGYMEYIESISKWAVRLGICKGKLHRELKHRTMQEIIDNKKMISDDRKEHQTKYSGDAGLYTPAWRDFCFNGTGQECGEWYACKECEINEE